MQGVLRAAGKFRERRVIPLQGVQDLVEQFAPVHIALAQRHYFSWGRCRADAFPKDLGVIVDDPKQWRVGQQAAAPHEVELQRRVRLCVNQRIGTVHLLDERRELLMDLETMKGFLKHQRERFMINEGFPQGIRLYPTDTDLIRVLGQPQSFEQCGVVPGQRLFKFMAPGSLMVVLQFWRIGVGPCRMLDAVLAGVRVLFDLIMLALQRQHRLVVDRMQPQLVGFGVRCQFDRGRVRVKVGLP